MGLSLLAGLLGLVSLLALLFILLHAFSRSVGTGFLVLLMPLYVFWYAFSQFEHRRKNVILAVWLGTGGLALMLWVATRAALPRPLY